MSERDIVIAGGLENVPLKEQWGVDYKRPKRFAWLADAAWWVLNKMNALQPHWGTVQHWRFRAVETSPDILQAIFNIADRDEVFLHRDRYAIVMGVEDYMKLIKRSDGMPPTGFDFQAGPFGYRGRQFNLPVHVVTTMSGVAAIPRVIIEYRPCPPTSERKRRGCGRRLASSTATPSTSSPKPFSKPTMPEGLRQQSGWRREHYRRTVRRELLGNAATSRCARCT